MKLEDRIGAVASAAADNPWLGDLTAENILVGWNWSLAVFCNWANRRDTVTHTAWSSR